MATEAAVSETCFDNYFTEETFDAAMVRQNEITKQQNESNEDSSSEDNAEIEATDDSKTDGKEVRNEKQSECAPSPSETSMEIDIFEGKISNNVIKSESDVNKAEASVTSTENIINLQIQDELSDQEREEVENNTEVASLEENTTSDKSTNNEDETKNSTVENVVSKEDEIPRIPVTSTNALKATNVVVLNPKNNFSDKNILNTELLKGQKVFLLNRNVISKEEVEKTKTDNINIICVSNNLNNINDIIKNINNDSGKPGRSLLTNTEGAEKSNAGVVKGIEKLFSAQPGGLLKATSIGPKFIQLTQNNLKNISPKISFNIAPTVTKPIAPKPVQVVKKPGEILRTKLLENGGPPLNRNSPEPVIVATKNRTSAGAAKKDEEPESPAVAKARSEFIRCRKQLIEAAIHPQLPTYKPPVDYDGPTYSCEECDDTFSNMDSLKNHKNRRSVLFTYACPLCKCTLEFFNRCTFLLHVRSHDAAVKACYLTISTIPADKLNFKLLQSEEAEDPLAPDNKPVQRTKERVIRKEPEETANVTSSTEVKENGVNKPKSINKAVDKSSILKGFDFIKSLKKSKFSTYLQNRPSVDKDCVSSSSDDTSDDDTSSERKTSEDSPMPNGDSNSSQLKYYLTKDKQTPKNPYKRALEDIIMKEDDGKKKLKTDTPSEPDKPTKPQPPVIIKAKTATSTVSKPVASTVSKPTTSTVSKPEDKNEEITLTSTDDEDDQENAYEEEKRVICRDCRTEVTNLNKHYKLENKPMKDYPCEQCKFFNPSACALAAHNRMHSKVPPYICPDCGFYFSTLDTFQTHTRQVCYYDYKTIRFQCPECSMLKPSVPQFAEHLKLCHTRDVFKCSLCITSSYSPKVVEIHMKKKHEGETGSVLEGYRCMLCPNILVSKKSIDTHINKHVFSLKHLRYVYICKSCKKYASGKINKFVEHLNVCSDKKKDCIVDKPKEKSTHNKTPSGASIKRVVKPNRNRAPKPASSKEVIEVEEKDPLSVEDWEADKLKAEFIPKAKICVMCQSADMDNKSNSLFCSACVRYVNAEDNSNETSDNTETKPDSGRPKRKFKCRLCKQFMNKDWATITQHYEKDHHSDFNVKKDAKSRQTKDAEAKKTDAAPPAVNIIKKRRPSTKESPAKMPKLKAPDTTPGYKCVKCGNASTNREEFHAHIRTHKEATDKQCLECGECFTVGASLAKHLIIVHNIRNLRKYYLDNGLLKDEKPEEKESLVENQCEVCYLKCETKQKYDKHIRIHGMAFVAMQSRSKDEKSPRG